MADRPTVEATGMRVEAKVMDVFTHEVRVFTYETRIPGECEQESLVHYALSDWPSWGTFKLVGLTVNGQNVPIEPPSI